MKFMIEGKDIDVLLETKEGVEEGIKGFAKNYPSYTTIGDLITKLRSKNQASSNDDQAPGFTGIGGALGNELLTIIEEEALAAADTYDTNTSVVVSLEGKIIHYRFIPDTTNPAQGNGELTVITAVSSRTYLPNGTISPTAKTVGYKWQIEVEGNSFEIHENCHLVLNTCGPDDQPFPDAMDLSEAMKDRVKSLGFKIKLWAEGVGIVVHNVWRKENFNWNAANNNSYWGNALDRNDARWTRFYETDDQSCIDFMFASTTPPTDLSGLGAPPFYCLGRCADPAIVNSR